MALSNYGISRAISNFGKKGKKRKVIKFLKTYLIVSTMEKHTQTFKQVFQILDGAGAADAADAAGSADAVNPQLSVLGFILTSKQVLKIFHFKAGLPGQGPSKTALNWANENNDHVMVMDLLQLEKRYHESELEGLECLRRNLSSTFLLPWISTTYSNFYPKSTCTLYRKAIMKVIPRLLITFLFFFYDFATDINLANVYKQIAWSTTEVFNLTTLMTCGGSQQNYTSCYDTSGTYHPMSYSTRNNSFPILDGEGFSMEADQVAHMFEVAFAATVFIIVFTSFVTLCCIVFDPSPRFIEDVPENVKAWGKRFCNNEPLLQCLGWICQKLLWCLCKIFWPFVHMWRQVRYAAWTKPSKCIDQFNRSNTTWNNIKTAEHGLEASCQLLLQLWLLRPFLFTITAWSTKELGMRCGSGIANLLTLNTLPACYIDKALAKILLTSFSLSLGVAQIKCNKAGQGLGKKPFQFAIFIGTLAQTMSRVLVFTILILLQSPLGYYKYALFFLPHFLLIFLIKVLFETKAVSRKCSTRSEYSEYSECSECSVCIGRSVDQCKTYFFSVLRFVVSGMSSLIVMMHLRVARQDNTKLPYSFLSHTLFLLLVLVENVVLVNLPFLVPDMYPQPACFSPESRTNAVLFVIGMWILAVLAQAWYYKISHFWGEVNGPHASNSASCRFKTKLGWMEKEQLVRVTFFDKNCLSIACEDVR